MLEGKGYGFGRKLWPVVHNTKRYFTLCFAAIAGSMYDVLEIGPLLFIYFSLFNQTILL